MTPKDMGLALCGIGLVICFVSVVFVNNSFVSEAWANVRDRCSSWFMWIFHIRNRWRENYYDLSTLEYYMEQEEVPFDSGD